MISVAVVNPVFTSITEIGKILPNRRALEDKNAKRMKAKKYRPIRYKKDVSVVFFKNRTKNIKPRKFSSQFYFWYSNSCNACFYFLVVSNSQGLEYTKLNLCKIQSPLIDVYQLEILFSVS